MQSRGLMAATVALALLAAGVWYSNREEAKKQTAPKADAPPRVLAVPMGDLREVIVDRASDHVRIARNDKSEYAILEPVKAAADTEAVTALFLQFATLDAERVVDEKPADLAQFGLNPAKATVTAVRKQGSPVKLLLGESSPTGTATYAKLEGEPRVFTLTQPIAEGFSKSFNDLRDKRLIPFDRDSLTSLVITSKGSTEITPGKPGWKVGGARADGSAVDQLVGALEQARMDPKATPEALAEAAKAWANAVLVATVRATDAAGAHTMEVRRAKTKDKDLVYIKSASMDGIHTGTAELADALAKPAAGYRNLTVFDFGFDDPTKVEVKGTNLNRLLIQADGKWSESNRAMDPVGAQSLVDKLRELKASSLVPQPGGAVELEVVATSNNNQRVEHVVVTKQGTAFVARREGEPEYYALTAQAVNELRQAASDVKEAAKATTSAPQSGKK